jgi:uncharacterized membrane protein
MSWSRGVRVLGLAVLVALAVSGPMLAQSVSSQTLIYAVYDGEKTASDVLQTMRSNQKATGEHIQSYAVVSKDMKGKVRVRDQRERDAKVGAVIGGVIGVLGGPAGAVAGAAAGGSLGFLTGNEVGISKDMVGQMKTSLTPGNSALAVVLDDRWVQDVEKGLTQAHARQVVAEKIVAGAKNGSASSN